MFADVTPFDLAVDAWRCETEADITRLEWVALLVIGLPDLRRDPVIAPNGKENQPLDQLIAKARRRISGVRDHLSPSMRAVAIDNEHAAREAARLRGRDSWDDREARIERLGFINATSRPRSA